MNLKFIFALLVAVLFLVASAGVAPAGFGDRPGDKFFFKDNDRFDNNRFFDRDREEEKEFFFFEEDDFFFKPCFFFCKPHFFFREFGD